MGEKKEVRCPLFLLGLQIVKERGWSNLYQSFISTVLTTLHHSFSG